MGIYSTEGIIVDNGITGNTLNFNFINLSGTNINNIFYNANSNPSPDNFVTGGTYSNGTLTLNRQNGSVIINGFSTGGTGTGIDTYVTGFTYNNNVLTISQNQSQPNLSVTLPMDIYITGGTLNRNTDTIILFRQGGNVNITGITDTFLTGGTFNSTTRVLTLSQNENGPNLTITGITDNFITGGTLDRNVNTITLFRPNGSVIITGITDTYITGFTYSNNNLIINQNEGLAPLTVAINNFTGLTVNGDLTVTSAITTNTFKITNNPVAGYVLTSDATGNAIWQSTPVIGSGSTRLDIQTVSTSATTTSTAGASTWVDVGSMSLTAKNLGSSATTYTINFSCTAALSSNGGAGGRFRVVLNGNLITNSERQRINSATQMAGSTIPLALNCSVTNVKNGDIIKVQFNSIIGQWTVTDRVLTIMGVLTQNLV